MKYYLVFDHYYSGIIQSQVIDLDAFIEKEGGGKFKIIAFLNIRRFVEARKRYAEHAPQVLVLPNFGFSRWMFSAFFLVPLAFVQRPSKVVGRSVFACQLGLILRKLGLTREVILDARGAEHAEWSEYFFPANEGPLPHAEIWRLEQQAVAQANARLAVSSKLIEYWHSDLKVSNANEQTAIIPSTLSDAFLNFDPSKVHRRQLRESVALPEDSLVFAFSGSRSDWHSMDDVLGYCARLAEKYSNAHFLFLTNTELNLENWPQLKGRIQTQWVKQEEVPKLLSACDYGLLLRNPSVTNKVSSPVKFAEYLSCGLKVSISDSIGDLSEFVVKNGVGDLVKQWAVPDGLSAPDAAERNRNRALALNNFSKEAHKAAYLRLFGENA